MAPATPPMAIEVTLKADGTKRIVDLSTIATIEEQSDGGCILHAKAGGSYVIKEPYSQVSHALMMCNYTI